MLRIQRFEKVFEDSIPIIWVRLCCSRDISWHRTHLGWFNFDKKIIFCYEQFETGDIATKNPYTRLYDLDPTNLSQSDGKKKRYVIQSRKWCFPFKYCMGRETNKMYQEECKDLFELMFCASMENQSEIPEWKPLNFSNPADMAAIQKSLGIGGACKVKNVFVIAAP